MWILFLSDDIIQIKKNTKSEVIDMSIMTKTRERNVQMVKELGKVVEVPINAISANSDQPRKNFDAEELTKLAKSISQDGIIQPLIIRKAQSGYELVSGERRLRAAKMAGFRSVPCVVVDISDKRSAVIALVENIQRADLDFFEEANAISALIEKYSMTQEDAAIRLGMAQSTIANKLRLLNLTAEEQRLIHTNSLSERHARALLKIGDEAQRKEILTKVIRNKMNVAQTEKYISECAEKEKIKKSYRKRAAVFKDIRLFLNTVDKAVEVIKLAGIDTQVQKKKQNGFIEYTIRIADNSGEEVNI